MKQQPHTSRQEEISPVQVGTLIRYRLYHGDGLVVVKVISIIQTRDGTKGVIEVPNPYVFSCKTTTHIYPGQRYRNANLTATSSGRVYKHLWYNCNYLKTLRQPLFPPRIISNETIDLNNGSLAPPNIVLKLADAIAFAKQKKGQPHTGKLIFVKQDRSDDEESDDEESDESDESDDEDRTTRAVSDHEDRITRAVSQSLVLSHVPTPISLSRLPKPNSVRLNWDFPENAVGIEQAKRMRKLYMNETEWSETSPSVSTKCYEQTSCALIHNKLFNNRKLKGIQKKTCQHDERALKGVRLPFKFCTMDSFTRTTSYKTAIYNTAKFRLCSFCTQFNDAYNARRYSNYCLLCLKATASNILCARCTSKVNMTNNESGAFVTNYIIDLMKVICNLEIKDETQTTCKYGNKTTRVDMLFKGTFNKNINFTIIIEYDEQEHNKYDPEEEYEKMLIQLKCQIPSAQRLLFVRFNPKLGVSKEGMKRLITLRQWIFWWIKNLVKVKDVLIFYMFYTPTNKRICFNDYDGMFLLSCPPKPSQQGGWDYSFVPEEQNYLEKVCEVQHFQDIEKAAERTGEKEKDSPSLRDLQRFNR